VGVSELWRSAGSEDEVSKEDEVVDWSLYGSWEECLDIPPGFEVKNPVLIRF
jgi:hypothetical protein